jgi:hypothetical protein
MQDPDLERKWIQWKAEKTQQVNDQWGHTIEKLYENPEVRFFKHIQDPKESNFAKKAEGNLTKYYRVNGPHMYGTQQKQSVSWNIPTEDGTLHLMPYDLFL